MKYKPGDEVLVKAEITDVSDCSERPYFVAPDKYSVNWVSEDKIIPIGKTYADGLTDAWGLAKSIALLPEYGGISNGDLVNMFGTFSMEKIFKGFTVEEALAKIEAYKKEKSEIKVGDEVVHGIGGFETEFIVTSMSEGMIRGFDSNGITHSFTFPNRFITKTGNHIDIESLLRQIGE